MELMIARGDMGISILLWDSDSAETDNKKNVTRKVNSKLRYANAWKHDGNFMLQELRLLSG